MKGHSLVTILRDMGVILFCALLALGGPGTLTGLGASQQMGNSPAVSIRYVATYGSDAGPNDCLNQAAPCSTTGHAIGQSSPGDVIHVAQGTYVENINIDQPLELLGGYQDYTWNRDVSLYETIIDGSNSREIPGDWDGDRVGIPTVIAVPGGYRMWYDAENRITGWASGLADSSDGASWSKYAGNPVLTPAGGDIAWDNWFRGQVSMMLVGGTYKMWYSGGGVPAWQTGYATSPDGVSWTIYASNPVLPVGAPGSWDEIEADGPSVILDGGTYKMWYHGCVNDYSVCSIGYATSPDGMSWIKHPSNPVLVSTPGTWDESGLGWPRVIKKGATYEMWYTANNQVGRATSPDGVSWTKDPGSPVIASDWEGKVVRGVSVLFDGSTYRMWFRSGAGYESRIGYATSLDGIAWTMHPNNPVLTTGTPTVWGESTVSVSGAGDHTLDGFSITGAKACQEGMGGVSINKAKANVSHCNIYGNEATAGCGGGGIGAAGPEADLTLEHSQVHDNTANDGGGVMSWDGANITMNYTEVYKNTVYGWGGGGVEVMQNGAQMLVYQSYIHDNDSGDQPGGGAYAKEFASFVIKNSRVENNHGGQGGGLFIESGQALGDNVQLLGNSAKYSGGGAWVEGGASFELNKGMVQGNSAQDQGGGLAHMGDLTLLDSEVLGNTAYGGGGGGGIAVFGPDGGGTLNAVNTVIAHNQGVSGGGIMPFWRGSLVNVTVANNTCSQCGNAGIDAPSDNLNSPRKIQNTIVYFNNPGSLWCDGDCQASYSDIQGGWPGTGNFDAPPMFVGAYWDDYRLDSGSPCIDTGTGDQAPDHDREGDLRPTNHGFDVGADEYGAPYGMGPAVLRLEPADGTQYVGQPFQVQIQVVAGGQQVDGAEAHLDFDTSKLQVTGVVAGTALPLPIQNNYDNVNGTVDYAAGAMASFPSGTFTLAAVTFNPIDTTSPDTTVSFSLFLPRESNVAYGGDSVLDHTEIAKYVVSPTTILGAISLQGRPLPPNVRWITPLTVKLTLVGQTTPAYEFYPTTDSSGSFTVEGITPGDYKIVVKNSHTLANKKTVTVNFGPNALSFGTLREGDADNNNCVAMVDFSILVTTFGKKAGDIGYDDRADFNEDNNISITDFSLMPSNFGLCGDLPVLSPLTQAKRSSSQPGVDVMILIQPPARTVKVGQTFTMNVDVQSGVQMVDGAEAHLNFDPTALQVTQISGNTALFPAVLQNWYDNNAGTLDYAAGTFLSFPSGTMTLATVEFQALKEVPLTDLVFQFAAPRLTDVTFGGASVLTQHQDGSLTILPKLKIYLPVIVK